VRSEARRSAAVRLKSPDVLRLGGLVTAERPREQSGLSATYCFQEARRRGGEEVNSGEKFLCVFTAGDGAGLRPDGMRGRPPAFGSRAAARLWAQAMRRQGGELWRQSRSSPLAANRVGQAARTPPPAHRASGTHRRPGRRGSCTPGDWPVGVVPGGAARLPRLFVRQGPVCPFVVWWGGRCCGRRCCGRRCCG
jgi:hypothetical protein